MKIQIIIPVYNPDDKLIRLINMLKKQIVPFKLLIIDSGSDGAYRRELSGLDVRVEIIDKKDFNHGGTRRWAAEVSTETDLLVFMTQDAIPVDEKAIANLIAIFANPRVGCAYGRQLPHKGAGLFATHARSFNYGADSYLRGKKDIKKYGMKAAFLSDTFAAYRRTALMEVGSFPENVIFGEDMYVAAKMLQADWLVGYQAAARVYHSHDYSLGQEYRRYFDMGVFHAQEPWIRKDFGTAEGAGGSFVKSEIKYLLHHNPLRLPEMVVRDAMKWLGYRAGIASVKR